MDPIQLDLPFDELPLTSGSDFDAWRAARRRRIEDLARRAGFPIGHPVEVGLVSGPRLTGLLLVADDGLFPGLEDPHHLRMRIGHADFLPGEIESCVRLD